MKFLLLIHLYLILNGFSCIAQTENPAEVSAQFLEAIKDGKPLDTYIDQLAKYNVAYLEQYLDNDDKRLAFWINVYNGFIQHILSASPEQYEDRNAFFKKPMIDIAGRTMSFASIEHGIIRHSQYELFLGYLTKLFPPDYEKRLRVKERDSRIHFALNCGAKSCPPVKVYRHETLQRQLTESTISYLGETTIYHPEADHAEVVALFSWFRGDFGGGEGIRDMLVQYNAVNTRPEKVTTLYYDWTLDLDNWR
jgi:hypothetical protein